MSRKEELATQYAEECQSCYTNDYYGFINGYEAAKKEYKEKISKIYSKYLSMTSEHHYEIYEELNQDRLKHER